MKEKRLTYSDSYFFEEFYSLQDIDDILDVDKIGTRKPIKEKLPIHFFNFNTDTNAWDFFRQFLIDGFLCVYYR